MAIFNTCSYVKLPEGIYAWTDFSGLIGTWILIPDTRHPRLFQGRGPSVLVPERCLRSKRACDNILVMLNAIFSANSCQITDFFGGPRFWAIAKSCPSGGANKLAPKGLRFLNWQQLKYQMILRSWVPPNWIDHWIWLVVWNMNYICFFAWNLWRASNVLTI